MIYSAIESLSEGDYMNIDDTLKKLEKNFNAYIQRYIIQQKLTPLLDPIFDYFRDYDMKYYIVGGIIRDYIMGKVPKDLDIAYEGDFNDVVKFLKWNCKYNYQVNPDFLTIKIFYNGAEIDLVNCRSERYLGPGALPQVKDDSVYEDMRRRDLTVNSIAYSMTDHRFIDIFDGIRDIKSKVIKLNYADSLIDDPTRLLRAMKYKSRYKFKYDPTTQVIMENCMAETLLQNISKDRLLNEFSKMLDEKDIAGVFMELDDFGVLKHFMPRCIVDTSFKVRLDQFVTVRQQTKENLLLLYYIFDEFVPFFVNEYNHSKKMAIDLSNIGPLKREIKNLSVHSTASEIYNVFSKYSDSLLKIAYHIDKSKVRDLIDFYTKILKHVKCPINGTDLISYGVTDGLTIKNILKKALDDTLDDKNLMLTKDEIIKKYTQSRFL